MSGVTGIEPGTGAVSAVHRDGRVRVAMWGPRGGYIGSTEITREAALAASAELRREAGASLSADEVLAKLAAAVPKRGDWGSAVDFQIWAARMFDLAGIER